MHTKLKAIREYIGLSEAQISLYLNISCYKYKRIENGTIDISLEIVLLLSYIYDILIDYLIFDSCSLDSILNNYNIQQIKRKRTIVSVFEQNLSKNSSIEFLKVSYKIINKIKKESLKILSNNIHSNRLNLNLEIGEISALLKINYDEYCLIEQGRKWPSVDQVSKITSLFCVSVHSLFEKQKP